MHSGVAAARDVSDIVLLRDSFAHLPALSFMLGSAGKRFLRICRYDAEDQRRCTATRWVICGQCAGVETLRYARRLLSSYACFARDLIFPQGPPTWQLKRQLRCNLRTPATT